MSADHCSGRQSQPSSISRRWGWGEPGRGALPSREILTDGSPNYCRALCFAMGLLPAAVRGSPGALSHSDHRGLHEKSQV